MSRPKKNSEVPGARQRIIDALWTLLETEHISQLGIKSIVAEAGCNRATFYYHFQSAYDLLEKAIVAELVEVGTLPLVIFSLTTQPAIRETFQRYMVPSVHRLNLAMKNGGSETVSNIVYEQVMGMWKKVLCVNGKELTPRSQAILRYGTNGILGLFCWEGLGDEGNIVENMPFRFLERLAPAVVESLCEEQGVSLDVARARAAVITRL